jgi:hypothetical protein
VCTDLTTFHDYSDGSRLTEVCGNLDGILDDKSGRAIFVQPISKGAVNDPGAKHRKGAPVICTEFGGVNIATAKDSSKSASKEWGYTTASDPEDLLQRFESLIMAVTAKGHCCGFVYTQL